MVLVLTVRDVVIVIEGRNNMSKGWMSEVTKLFIKHYQIYFDAYIYHIWENITQHASYSWLVYVEFFIVHLFHHVTMIWCGVFDYMFLMQ